MLSAVVITQNEEKNIERCLRSLGFADEIVVVDAMSGDRTPELAASLGARIISRPWPGFAAQKQFAIDQAAGDWVLLVDADEEVSGVLADEIRRRIEGDPTQGGFRIRRRNQFLGKWVHHGPWANDFQLRLFRKSRGAMVIRPVHEGVEVDGETGTLTGALNHYTHQTLTDSVRRLNVYTTLEASERVSRRRIGVFDPIIPPLGLFLRYYLARGCWRDGVHGFLLAATTAMYRSVLYLKIRILQQGDHASASQ